MQSINQTIISQYINAPVLTTLVYNVNDYLDPSANLDLFYDNLWNIDTATGYGLDVWGRIVGVTRVVRVAISPPFFGFFENLPFNSVGFGQGPFWDGSSPIAGPYTLDDDQYRTLIFAKALANICDGSIPAINQILLNLFPSRGNCYVTDGLNGSMVYVFSFTLASYEYAIVTQSGVLPRTSGVSSQVSVP